MTLNEPPKLPATRCRTAAAVLWLGCAAALLGVFIVTGAPAGAHHGEEAEGRITALEVRPAGDGTWRIEVHLVEASNGQGLDGAEITVVTLSGDVTPTELVLEPSGQRGSYTGVVQAGPGPADLRLDVRPVAGAAVEVVPFQFERQVQFDRPQDGAPPAQAAEPVGAEPPDTRAASSTGGQGASSSASGIGLILAALAALGVTGTAAWLFQRRRSPAPARIPVSDR